MNEENNKADKQLKDYDRPRWWQSCEHIAEIVNRIRLIPRTIVGLYGWVFWEVAQWFMSLDDPSGTQAAFVSTIVGAAAAFFGLYVNSSGKK